MARRVVKARAITDEILNLENNINYVLEQRGYTCRVGVQWAYGQPSCSLIVDPELLTTSDLSPRLPKKDMVLWLQAFYDGLTFKPPYVNRGGKFRGEE